MGQNDPLPPPPPPGPRHMPPPPPVPPAVPRFAPGNEPAAPTVAMPSVPPTPPAVPQFDASASATIPMPVVREAPAVVPPAAPRRPATTGPATAPPPAHRPGAAWIVVGVAVAVVAGVLAAVFALSGEDETVLSAPTTIVPVSVTESTTGSTAAVTTAPLIDTTVAASTDSTAPVTAAPTTAPLEPVVVADDTRAFSVLLLDTFQTRTSPQDVFGGTFASVRGAADIDAFEDPADRAEFGAQVVVGPADQMPAAADILAELDPGAAACADRTVNPAYSLQSGPATLQMLDACGTDQASAQVDLVFDVGGRRVVVHTKGTSPANTDLVDFAQAVAESIVFF